MIIPVGSGTSLNFKIKVYESFDELPSSAKENDITVITSTAMSEWIFSFYEPENPVDDMVWFRTALLSDHVFDALKKNGVMIYPREAFQYVSGEWIPKKSYRYVDSQWKPILRLPLAYQEVEYLENSGTEMGTRLIDTGIHAGLISDHINMELKVEFPNLKFASGANRAFAGTGDTTTDADGPILLYINSSGNTSPFVYKLAFNNDFNGRGYILDEVSPNVIYTIEVQLPREGSAVIRVNGVEKKTWNIEPTATITRIPFGLLAPIRTMNTNLVPVSGSNPIDNRVYYAKFVIDGRLAKEFIPCYRVSDSVAGMYDIVGDRFYECPLSGTFIVGGDV